jgi:hypothetical protein
VVIPTLGTSPYLVESVESVLNQSLSSWQLLISVNGTSETKALAPLARYLADQRVRRVVTGILVDRGTHYTRLIKAGSAPFVCLLHDDDRLKRDFLRDCAAFLQANPGCGFVFSDYSIIDGDGREIARTRLKLKPGIQKSSEIVPNLYRRMFVSSPSVMVRRAAYEAIGAEFKDIQFSDHEMWIRLASHFDVGYVPTCNAEYRFHTSQSSARRSHEGRESLRVLDAADDLPIPRRTRRVARAEAHLWCAFDSIEESARSDALRHLGEAFRADPLLLVRPRLATRAFVAVGALVMGGRGGRGVARLRDRRWDARRRHGVSFTTDVSPVGSRVTKDD